MSNNLVKRINAIPVGLIATLALLLFAWSFERSNRNLILGNWKATHANCHYKLRIESNGKFKRSQVLRVYTVTCNGTYRRESDGAFLFVTSQVDVSTGRGELASEEETALFRKANLGECRLRIGNDGFGALIVVEEDQSSFLKNSGSSFYNLNWELHWEQGSDF